MDFIHYRTVKISKDLAYNGLKVEVSTLYRKGKPGHTVTGERG